MENELNQIRRDIRKVTTEQSLPVINDRLWFAEAMDQTIHEQLLKFLLKELGWSHLTQYPLETINDTFMNGKTIFFAFPSNALLFECFFFAQRERV